MGKWSDGYLGVHDYDSHCFCTCSKFSVIICRERQSNEQPILSSGPSASSPSNSCCPRPEAHGSKLHSPKTPGGGAAASFLAAVWRAPSSFKALQHPWLPGWPQGFYSSNKVGCGEEDLGPVGICPFRVAPDLHPSGLGSPLICLPRLGEGPCPDLGPHPTKPSLGS